MITYQEFCDNCSRVEERVRKAAESCGRDPETVKILPVTKNHPLDAARFAFKRGFKSVGENRVQEALGKIASADFSLDWELIGHLQSNKAKHAAANFARIQSVDSQKLLKILDSAAASEGKVLRVLLQVNAGNDPAKFGADISDAPELLDFALKCGHIKVEGLMTIAPLDSDLDVASECFANLRNLRDILQKEFSHPLPELSMGMSGDLERAVAEGSTMVRIGTSIFGERIYA